MNRLSTMVAVLLVIVATSCSKKDEPATGSTATAVQINGAGSTFVNPIMTKW